MIAAAGRTIRSALLEAGDMRIAVVAAARAMGEVTAEGSKRTDLRSREAKRRSRNARIGLVDARVGRDRGDRAEGADAGGPVGGPVDPDQIRRRGDIDQGSHRNSAAPPFGKVGTGGAQFGALAGDGHGCGCHAAALRFSAAIRRAGRIGISLSLIPVALRTALARAGDVGTVSTSPLPTLPPSTSSKPPSSKATSISGAHAMPRT